MVQSSFTLLHCQQTCLTVPVNTGGKVVSVTSALWWAGPAIFSAFYANVYHPTRDVADYFVLKLLLSVIVCSLCMIFLHLIPNTDCNKVVKVESSLVTAEVKTKQLSSNVTNCQLVRKIDFHLLLWHFSLSCGVQVIFFNNVVPFLQYSDLQNLNLAAIITGPTCGFSANLTIGFLSDYFINKVSRATFILGTSILQTFIFILCIPLANEASVFIIAVIITYASN